MVEATDNRLLLLVQRIERISEEIKGLQDDRKDVYAEAKAVGYDAATIRKLVQRRAMDSQVRAETDLLLETYEAALGGGEDPAVDRDAESAALAHAILAEQIEGIADGEQAARLIDHVAYLLDVRAEIALLRTQEAYRKKVAKEEGFLPKQISAVVRWIEKCAKHGTDMMRAGEATFQMYRGTVEGRGITRQPASDDPKLQQIAGGGRSAAKDRALAQTMAWLETGMGN